jgi:hypothetical protein
MHLIDWWRREEGEEEERDLKSIFLSLPFLHL